MLDIKRIKRAMQNDEKSKQWNWTPDATDDKKHTNRANPCKTKPQAKHIPYFKLNLMREYSVKYLLESTSAID